MENKYYVPDIESFHPGFEFEYFKSTVAGGLLTRSDGSTEVFESETKVSLWELGTVGFKYEGYFSNNIPLEKIEDMLRENKIRVKFLDRQDIEELGWVNDKLHYYKKGNIWLMTLEGKIKVWIEDNVNDSNFEATLFWGTIRNKSELARLIKMLNIE